MRAAPLKVSTPGSAPRRQALDGPVWGCDCGTILAVTAPSPARANETVCDACARRYRHQQIGHGAWRVVLLSARE